LIIIGTTIVVEKFVNFLSFLLISYSELLTLRDKGIDSSEFDMEALREKSEFNFMAAELLMDKHQIYSSSIHCLYYSTLQLAKHIIIHVYGKTDHSIAQELNTATHKSHENVRNYIIEKLKEKKQPFLIRDFNKNFNQLKVLRENSDYKEISISLDDALKSKDLSFELNKLLKKTFINGR